MGKTTQLHNKETGRNVHHVGLELIVCLDTAHVMKGQPTLEVPEEGQLMEGQLMQQQAMQQQAMQGQHVVQIGDHHVTPNVFWDYLQYVYVIKNIPILQMLSGTFRLFLHAGT